MRRRSKEEIQGLQQLDYGKSLGFVYDSDAEKALELANRIMTGDPDAWDELDVQHNLMFNVESNLRAAGEYDLAAQVKIRRLSINESRHIKTQEQIMRIRGLELRQIIKEELRRTMLNEDDKPTAYKVQKLDSMELDYTYMPGLKKGDKFTGKVTFSRDATPISFLTADGKTIEFAVDSPIAPVPYKNKSLEAELTVLNPGGPGILKAPSASVKLIDNLSGTVKV